MRQRQTQWLLVAATLLFFWLALDSMVGDSPTMDEQNHLARGLAFLRTGDPRLSLEHPPLVNAISALPLLTLPEIVLPTEHPSWSRPQGWYEFADILLWQANHDVTRMIFLARLPIVFLTLGLALTGFHFAQALWQRAAGVLAYLLLLFDPNILAHGRYTTTDLGGALFTLLAAFAIWRLWQAGDWRWQRLLAGGVALGLAYGSKLSALAFAPIFALVALLPLYGNSEWLRPSLRRLAEFAACNAIAALVLWAIFAFQWGALEFADARLSFLDGLRAPMPTFWAGVEQILLLSGGGRPSFLLGATATTGFTAYFPVAFLVKTPLATLVLLLGAVVLLIGFPPKRADCRKALFLLAPAVLYFLLSMQSGLNIGYRHLLPILPLIYVAIAGAIWRLVEQRRSAPASGWRALPAIAAPALVAILIASTLLLHPHYLSYFNLLGGGPANGYRILVDSNVDWGQDLLRLQVWMEENDVSRINLSWFGTADPAYYGIQYSPLPGLPRHFDLWWALPFEPDDPPRGIYAISVSNLWELPLQDDKGVFSWFRQRQPVDRVAYSILIYDVD